MPGGFKGVWDDGLIVEEDARWRITDIRLGAAAAAAAESWIRNLA